jgi:hypothetical protein
MMLIRYHQISTASVTMDAVSKQIQVHHYLSSYTRANSAQEFDDIIQKETRRLQIHIDIKKARRTNTVLCYVCVIVILAHSLPVVAIVL